MPVIYSFGEWVKQQRKRLRLTQGEVAAQSHCALATIKKIEADQRRPSAELAELLAQVLHIPPEQHDIFIQCARGQRSVDALAAAQRDEEAEKPPPHPFRRPTPLPLSATPFIGRTAELAQIADKLADPNCRLLTLVGPGGVGKTRLGLAAAHAEQKNFGDGTIFVPLAAIDDADGLVLAIARVFNQPLTGAEPTERQLQRLLHAREMLLVLDNFEQLVADAPMLTNWLAGASGLKLLVTSRERLNLAEEWLYPVSGFSPAQAVHLFGQTAQRVNPQFDLAGQTAEAAEICHLVDGLPLAIELAASWIRLMPCDRIANQIRQDLDFLSVGPRNAPERHRSLRALFDHSWRLLSPAEQAALARLSAFLGGFAPEEAAAVTGASWTVLSGLVDKSLVMAQANGRCDLHELTRHYAAAKLGEANQEPATRQQHFDTYLALAERLDAQLHGPDGIAAYARLDQEQDNLRAALRWGLETNQVDHVLRLVNHLFFFWSRRGYWREGEQWTAAAVAEAGEEDRTPLCLALVYRAILNALQGRYAEASRYLPRALAMARRLKEPEPLVAVLTTLAQATPDPQEAFAAWDEAMVLAQRNEKLTWRLAFMHMLYGDRLRFHGDYVVAATHYQHSLSLMRQMGNVDMIAYPLGNLGLLALHEGRIDEAYHLIAESVAISRATGNQVGVGDWIFRLGLVLLYLARTEEAIVSLQEAFTMYEEMNNLRGQASVLACLAQTALGQGQVALAVKYIRQSLATYQNLHHQLRQSVSMASHIMRPTQITFTPDEVDSLLRAVLVFSAQERFEQATTLLGATQASFVQSGHKPVPPLQTSVDQALEVARSHLSEATFAAAWEAGQTMSPDQVLTFALTFGR
jgi:predicted ATPase/DNA-binding XRE family transcriptional regulator